MTPTILAQLKAIAELLGGSNDPADRATAAILYTLRGAHLSDNHGAIQHLAEVAREEAMAYVLLHEGE